MRYIHWRDDFSITESFSEDGHSVSVPQRVRIEYFTARGHNRFVAERNGDTFVNCELSGGGDTLTVHLSLRDNPIGHGRLLRIATVITQDSHFPDGLKYNSYPGKLEAILYFGKSDGPLDLASEIVFDGVDRLSLLQDVDLSNPAKGDLLSWNGSRWANIPQSAIRQDLSDYVRWESLSDYVTTLQLQELIGSLPSTDELSSLSDRVTALEDVSFFTLDTNGNITLKEQYQNLWVPGWLSSGGIGSGSGGGGSLINSVYTWQELRNMATPPSDDATSVFNARSVYEIYQALSNISSQETDPVFTASPAHDITDAMIASWNNRALVSINTQQDGTLDFLFGNGDITKVDLNHDHSFYVAGTQALHTASQTALLGVTALSNALSSIAGSDPSRIEWDPNAGGTGIGAWHIYGNIYVDGWVASGGVGIPGGGGGATVLDDLLDVSVPMPSIGDFLYFNGTEWVASQIKTINQQSLIGSGNMTIQGAGGTVTSVGISVPTGFSPSGTPVTGEGTLTINYADGYALPTIEKQNAWDNAISDLSDLTDRVEDLEDLFELVNVAAAGDPPVYAIHAKNNYAIYSDAWVASGGIGMGAEATGGGVQKIKVGTATVEPDNNGLATITTPVLSLLPGWFSEYFSLTPGSLSSGVVVATVQIGNASPFNLYAPSGGGGSTVNWETPGSDYIPLTVNGSTKNLLTEHQSLTGYVTLTGNQEIIGPKTFKTNDVTLTAVSLVPYSSNSAGIGSASKRFANIYGNNIHVGPAVLSYDENDFALLLSGNEPMGDNPVGLEVNSFLDIGNARIVYDSGANALHITYKRGFTGGAVSIFADGNVSAGGISGQTSVRYVTVDGGDQSISGEKTFDDNAAFEGNVNFNGSAIFSAPIEADGGILLSNTINGLSITKDSNDYVTLNAPRIDIQDNGNNLFLCRGNGKVFLCANPGGTVTHKLYLDANSTAIAKSWNTHSDRRLKDDIAELKHDDALKVVMALKPSTWTWKSGGKSAGLIAQDVEGVVPWMVSGDESKALNYQVLHAFELSAIQSHEERIKFLEIEVDRLNFKLKARI